MNEHELGFLAFLEEPGRGRMRSLLELGAKQRWKAVRLLEHAVRLRAEYAEHLTGPASCIDSVEARLREHGAPALCHAISADADIDGRDLPLREALEAMKASGMGTYLSCLPGRLGYFEPEDIKSAYLLRK